MPAKPITVETYIIPYLLDGAKMGEQNYFMQSDIDLIKQNRNGYEILEATYLYYQDYAQTKDYSLAYTKDALMQIALSENGTEKIYALYLAKTILEYQDQSFDSDLKSKVIDTINHPNGSLSELFANSRANKSFKLPNQEIDSILSMEQGAQRLLSLYNNADNYTIGDTFFTPEHLVEIVKLPNGHEILDTISDSESYFFDPTSEEIKRNILDAAKSENPIEKINFEYGPACYLMDPSNLGDNAFTKQECDEILSLPKYASTLKDIYRFYNSLKNGTFTIENFPKGEIIPLVKQYATAEYDILDAISINIDIPNYHPLIKSGIKSPLEALMIAKNSDIKALYRAGICYSLVNSESLGENRFMQEEIDSILSKDYGLSILRTILSYYSSSANNLLSKMVLLNLASKASSHIKDIYTLPYTLIALIEENLGDNRFLEEDLILILEAPDYKQKINCILRNLDLLTPAGIGGNHITKQYMINMVMEPNGVQKLDDLGIIGYLKKTEILGGDHFTEEDLQTLINSLNGTNDLKDIYNFCNNISYQCTKNHITKFDIIKLAQAGVEDFSFIYTLNLILGREDTNHFSKEQLMSIALQENGPEKLTLCDTVNNIINPSYYFVDTRRLVVEDLIPIFNTPNYRAKLEAIEENINLLSASGIAGDSMIKQQMLDYIMQEDGENTIYINHGFGFSLQNDQSLGGNRFTQQDMKIIRSLDNWKWVLWNIPRHLMTCKRQPNSFFTKEQVIEIFRINDGSNNRFNFLSGKCMSFCSKDLGKNVFNGKDLMPVLRSDNSDIIIRAILDNIDLLTPAGIGGNHISKQKMIKLVVEPNGVESLYRDPGIIDYLMNSDDLGDNIFTIDQIEEIKGKNNDYHKIKTLYNIRELLRPTSIMGNNFFRTTEAIKMLKKCSYNIDNLNSWKNLMERSNEEGTSKVDPVSRFKVVKLLDLCFENYCKFSPPHNRANANSLIDEVIESLITPKMKNAIVGKIALVNQKGCVLDIGGMLDEVISYLSTKEVYNLFTWAKSNILGNALSENETLLATEVDPNNYEVDLLADG